jgi:transmembrane sensor
MTVGLARPLSWYLLNMLLKDIIVHFKVMHMEKSNFNDLLSRYLTGNVTDQEQKKIEAWLDVMKTSNTADLELKKEDEEKLFRKIVSKRDNISEITSIIPMDETREPGASRIMKIAASLILLMTVSLGIWYVVRNDNSKQTPAIVVTKKVLEDGSLVWLKGNSNLAYATKRSQGIRYAELSGEGLFEVAKDKRYPFIIRCGEATIRVVGTSFRLKSTPEAIELLVLTGIVNFSLPGHDSIRVEKNEKLTYTKNNPPTKQALSSTEAMEATANTEYNMQFNNTTLLEVVEKMEKKFNVDINIASKIGACRLTIDLTDHSLTNSLDMLSEVLDIEYGFGRTDIIISGNGCHQNNNP